MFYVRLIICRPESTAVRPSGGRLNNAAEYAFTKLDDLVNWARRVSTYCPASVVSHDSPPPGPVGVNVANGVWSSMLCC